MTDGVMVDGARVDVHPGEGPPMLLMHGFLSSRSQWRANLAALAAVCVFSVAATTRQEEELQ